MENTSKYFIRFPLPKKINLANLQPTSHDKFESDWCHLTTLGAKSKNFWWTLNSDDMSLTILRIFNTKKGKKKSFYTVSKNELDRMQQYVDNNKVCLANDVEKLRNGTEKDGIGRFFYDQLEWRDTTKAQLASQIAAIFTCAGIWDYNRRPIKIKFWKITEEWEEILKAFYTDFVSDA